MDGTTFGRYRLIELLGRGGMGEVWRARDTVTDRVVAIKVLPASLSEDAEFQHRFRREAHAAARLDTPHAVPIYDYGEIDGRLFVSMRLITGRDLAAVLGDGPLEPARAVRIVDQVAKALHAAHKIGLIHRDIKPSNILLDDDDFVYLIDFGIARAADETRMTKSGNIIGSFAYIAPERLDPQTEEDARADIYSLACVLYEALTGQPPFPGSTAVHLMYAHANTPPPRPSAVQPNVPTNLDEVVVRGMAKEPDSGYATTVELADAARDAITVPAQRPRGSAFDTTLPAGPLGSTLAATQLSDADRAHNIAPLRGAGSAFFEDVSRDGLGEQQMGCVGIVTDPPVFDWKAGAAQHVDDVRHRTQLEPVSSERQFCHHIGVGQSDDQSTPAVYHPGKFSECSVELGDEVDGVDRHHPVQCLVGEGKLRHGRGMQRQPPIFDVWSISSGGLAKHRLRHLNTVNTARRTDPVE